MTMHPENQERNIWADRFRSFGKSVVEHLQQMGQGFAQANLGEASLRLRGINPDSFRQQPAQLSQEQIAEANINAEVAALIKELPDFVPEDWQ